MSEDFYSVLGVGRDADEDEIRNAYRKKAAQYHPDVNDDPDAEETFKRIKKAKEVLTDEDKREAYDRIGHERFLQAEKRGGFDGPGAGAGRAGHPGAGGQGPFGGAAGGDPFGGGLGDLFEQFFGGGGGGRRGGADLRTGLTIDMADAYHGAKKQLTITRPEACPGCDGRGYPPDADSRTCPECRGRGQVTRVQQTPLGRVQQRGACPRCEGEGTLYERTCEECRGDGQVRRETTLEVEVPPGIRDGQTLRVEGEGAPGDHGTPEGDLLVEIEVEDHPDFERDGADLYRSLAISYPQAVFGDAVEVGTFDDPVEVEIPPGTQSGEQFRLRSEGMPRLTRSGRQRGYGDLYVVVQVVTPAPDELGEDQREALEAFAEAGGEDVDTEPDAGLFERLRESL